MFRGSQFLVEIPRFDITKWSDYLQDIKKYCFKGIDDVSFLKIMHIGLMLLIS